MKFNEIANKLALTASKAGIKVQKYSPEILAVVGTVGVIASAVMACKATTKVSEITEDTKHQIDMVHEAINDKELVESGKYTKEDSQKDLAIIYTQTAVKFAKLYGPAITLGTVSLACLLGSNQILRKRNAALAAAYATISKEFKEYRGRVIDRFGKEIDRELKYNIVKQQIEENVVDPETGEVKTEKKEVEVVDPDIMGSPYAKFFDEGCRGWEKDAEMNLMFLRSQQNYANDLLRIRGYVFLNDIYDMLGIERTRAGQIVGWVYDPKRTDIDNYIDFGIYNINRKKSRDFVNGIERVILLDFNVDGNILDLI